MMAQAVRATARPGTLLVLSSGLSTAGGFDLRQVGWGASRGGGPRAQAPGPAAPPQWLARQDLRAGRHRRAAACLARSPQWATLTRYWLALCQVAGAASCTVDAVTRPEPPPRSTTPVPVVLVPEVTSFRGPHGGQTTDVPADAFFAFASARLLPGRANPISWADRRQGPRCQHLQRDDHRIRLAGRRLGPPATWPCRPGAPGRSRRGSSRSGFPRPDGPAVGLGTAGQARPACYRHDRLDEALCARLRRVLITLRPARGPLNAGPGYRRLTVPIPIAAT